MDRKQEDICPIELALSIVGKKWTVLIIRELFNGRKRFTEIAASLPISTKLLASRLKELEQDGIINKTIFAENPPRVEYTLTESGRTLDCILSALRDWGTEHGQRQRSSSHQPATQAQ